MGQMHQALRPLTHRSSVSRALFIVAASARSPMDFPQAQGQPIAVTD